jgi:Flp pilus assembly protein TadG
MGVIMETIQVKEPVLYPLRNERGATAVIVSIFLVVLLAMGAAAIDIGHGMVARNELQNASDAAALAGARRLGLIYEGLTPDEMGTYTLSGGDAAVVTAAAKVGGQANIAAGVVLTIPDADVQIGQWNAATRTFTPTTAQPRAVRVLSRRDSTANGPISTFLGSVVGLATMSPNAVATAELTAIGSTPPGALDLPVAISEYFFSQYGCGDSIRLYPSDGTPESCAGFITFDVSPPNDINFRTIVNGMAAGTYNSPPTTAGQTSVNITNGTLSNRSWNALINLFDVKRGSSCCWDAQVPVYEGNACNPSGSVLIKGYANIRITAITPAPNHTITGNVTCPMFIAGGSGGGPAYGVFTTVSGLVE